MPCLPPLRARSGAVVNRSGLATASRGNAFLWRDGDYSWCANSPWRNSHRPLGHRVNPSVHRPPRPSVGCVIRGATKPERRPKRNCPAADGVRTSRRGFHPRALRTQLRPLLRLGAWQNEAQRLQCEAGALDQAGFRDLRKLLTLRVRKDRFFEGHVAEALREGRILAILRRMKAIQEEEGAA